MSSKVQREAELNLNYSEGLVTVVHLNHYMIVFISKCPLMKHVKPHFAPHVFSLNSGSALLIICFEPLTLKKSKNETCLTSGP